MKEILELSFNTIIKDKKTYNKYLKKRLSIFEYWKRKDISSSLKESFDRCITLTNSCHQMSEEFEIKNKDFLEKYKCENNYKLLENALKIINVDSEINEIGVTIDYIKNIDKISKDIMLKALNNKENKDMTLYEFIENETKTYNKFDKSSIHFKVGIMYKTLNSYALKMSIISDLLQLLNIYKGLFYSGIVNYQGKKLEGKIFKEHLKKITIEISGLGAFVTFYKFLNDILLLESEEILDNASFLDNYLDKYEKLLLSWLSIVTKINDAIDI
ncbi:hypothetical protein ACN09X_05045 [Aliarcobacter butzleri]|uniref:hypothetical protein n=1 Tax=Aliarcobacter butzleri TaxID=28197 RepID=UPI003AE40B4C